MWLFIATMVMKCSRINPRPRISLNIFVTFKFFENVLSAKVVLWYWET